VRHCQQNTVIPNVAHFIWFGKKLPWVHRVALRSAARVGQFSRVVLHHEAALDSDALSELRSLREFDARPIEVKALFRGVGVDPQALLRLFARLSEPAARTDVLRAAILAAEGGVYIDTDTVTVGSFMPLRSAEVFCGAERVIQPATLLHGATPRQVARAYGLTVLRDVLRRLPDGYRSFRRFETLYGLAPNNAVLGARPNHPFMLSLLDGMLRLPPGAAVQRHALGTQLLQETVTNFRGSGLVVHAPQVFYPLGPEISQHWFRMRSHVDLTSVLTAETRLVHWYASVRTRKLIAQIDPEYVLSREQHQLLSALLAPYAQQER
jgi:hypothetical protein